MWCLQHRLLLVQIRPAGETLQVERDKILWGKKSVTLDDEPFEECLEHTASCSHRGRQEMNAQNNLCKTASSSVGWATGSSALGKAGGGPSPAPHSSTSRFAGTLLPVENSSENSVSDPPPFSPPSPPFNILGEGAFKSKWTARIAEKTNPDVKGRKIYMTRKLAEILDKRWA